MIRDRNSTVGIAAMTKKNAMPAKLIPPVLPDIVDRPRLHRQLDRALKRPIVWISAPPGSGKTMLAASYARARRLRPLWYQIDAGDSDPATFFHYLGVGARWAAPRHRHPLPHLTPEYLPGLPIFTRRFFEQLFARLRKPALLVFDNYQEIPEQSAFHETVAAGLESSPPGVSVVFISRAEAPAAFSRLYAGRLLSPVDADALRLTEAESNRLVRLTAAGRGRRISRQAAKDLYDRTQGWIAGLILLLEQEEFAAAGPRAGPADPGSRVIAGYLMQEVMKHYRPETVSFLYKTALFPAMTADMARELTELPAAGEILAGLYRTRYFTLRFAGDPPFYRYHPLLREFLLASAAKTTDAETFTAWRRQAAGILERSGRAEDALALYHESGEVAELSRIIMTHAPLLLSQGRGNVVEQWIGRVPDPARRDMPWLTFWLAAATLPFNPRGARELFEAAHGKFLEQGDRAGVLLSWCGVTDAIWYAWEDLEQLDAWIDRFSSLAPPDGRMPAPEIEAAVACAMFNALFWRRPFPEAIASWAVKVTRVLEAMPVFAPQYTMNAVALINYHMQVGDMDPAEEILRLMDAALQREEASPVSEIGRYQVEAVVAVVRGDAERSARAVRRGLELSRTTGVPVWNVPLAGAGCLGALLVGDLAAAQRYVDQILAQSREGALVFRSWALSLQAGVAISAGDFQQARRAAAAALEMTVREGPFPEALSRFAMARALHAGGEVREAAAHLARARDIADRMQSLLIELGWRMMAALFAFDEGREDEGLQDLRTALRIGAATGILEWQGKLNAADMVRLCSKALEAGIEPDYVRRMIGSRRLRPDAADGSPEAWPWPVKVYTLGRFELVVDGKPVTFGRKAQKRPLDLLKALIAFGGRDVRDTRVIEALWPEAEGDAARQALAMALKRLRTLLGRDEAVLLSERRLTLDPRLCWVDVWALERGLAQGAKDPDAVAAPLALYRGSFLESDDASWALSLRERLRAKFLGQVRVLGRQLEARGDWTAAVRWYQRGLDVDDLAEELYQRLMVCHDRLGQRGEALSAYQRCLKALKAHLDVSPSEQTRTIYQDIALRQA